MARGKDSLLKMLYLATMDITKRTIAPLATAPP